ncbi:MAG: RsmB/NOP family class I SAM-dependent RNA methyltransferase [Myxococcota bacterium]
MKRPLREDLVTAACLEAYGSVRHEGRLADRALELTLRHKRHLYSNERRAVAERVYALLRRQRTVDFLLERARPDFRQLPTTRQDLLRFAAVGVLEGQAPRQVAKSLTLGGDAAVLDRLGAANAALATLPEPTRLGVTASLPDFLAELFLAELGKEAYAAAEAMNERAPLCARVNTLKTDRPALIARLRTEGVECRETPLSPFGLWLDTRLNAFSLPAFKEGLFELQDEGSQLLGMLVDAPPTKVVDACAGAGGKTLQLAAQMKNRGELFALDIDEVRLEALKKRARRAGVHNVRARLIPTGEEALAALTDLEAKAGRVLVDAPCSGSGTFRRKPDARYRLTPEELQLHVERQKALLARFATLVKPGGRLVYGTCSLLRTENEEVVEGFLSTHADFALRPVSEDLGPALGAKVSRDGCLRLFPHVHGTDGFFGAVLVKRNLPSPPTLSPRERERELVGEAEQHRP